MIELKTILVSKGEVPIELEKSLGESFFNDPNDDESKRLILSLAKPYDVIGPSGEK